MSSSLSTLQEQTIMESSKPFGDASSSIFKGPAGCKRKNRSLKLFQTGRKQPRTALKWRVTLDQAERDLVATIAATTIPAPPPSPVERLPPSLELPELSLENPPPSEKRSLVASQQLSALPSPPALACEVGRRGSENG